ncbi:MAG TPA: hypothetical protein VFB93_16410 [Burkholderiales bacterium]|nr:hypothetical protein [Burkholderiales bacterium]
MNRKTGRGLDVRGCRGSRSRFDHEIDRRQKMPVLPEIFANPTLDAVTRYGAAGGANTDREPEPRVAKIVQLRAHEKERVGRPQPQTVDGIEL